MELYLFEDLLKARDERALHLAAKQVIEKLGFDKYLYALAYRHPDDGRPEYYVLGNYPQAWLDRYIEKSYLLIDPSIPHCQRNTTPLIWTNRLFDAPEAAEMNREAIEFGINAGGCIPVHNSWLRGLGALSFSSGEDADRAYAQVAEVIGQAALLAGYVCQAVRNLALPADFRFQYKEELTQRELECLRWAALGLPAKRVADRMGISTSTVNAQHLPSIRRKLGARTTFEAAIIAIQQGLIQP